MIISKGTEPIFDFVLPFDVSEIKRARVTVRCPVTKNIVKKETSDLDMDGNVVTFRLTQQDTFCFKCNSFVEVQLRLRTINDVPLKSEVYIVFVDQCLDDEVI